MTNSNNKQFSSKALEVNLSETRKDTAEIPDIQQWFGEISRSQWGVYKRTQEFLKELNHKYRNNQYVIESLHTICLGDLWIYNEHEESEKALGVIVDIIRSILQSSIEVGQRELMIQIILRFMDRLVKLGDFPENIIFECLDLMRADMKNHELLYIRNSGYFKSYLDKVVEYPAFEKEILELTESVIDRSISYWEKTSKAEEWFQARKSLFHHMDQETIAQIGKPFFDQLKKEKAKATDWKSLTSLMFYNDISNYFRSFTEKFDSHLEAIYYLFYLLHLPGMTYLSDHLLYDMNRNLRNIFVDLNNEDTIDFINGIMNEFEELKENHGSTVLDCIVTLGKEIIATDDSKNIDHFVKSLIKLGFHYPGKVTLTDDWQIQINSNHIKNIRIWLELIECNPKQTQELLAALIIHLKLGGVFISDTDLFQRDVTQLLNADISPVYREMKQLARIFPVYFREIGAEGTLRDVTTALDEFSLRKDRLIHFLRKQVHTESNNTHIELCERIILFWAYGNKDRIKDLVPDDVYESIDFESKWFVLPHHTLESLAKDLSKTPEELLDYDLEIIERTLNKLPEKSVPDAKRVYDLFHVHTLLKEKYSFESNDVIDLIHDYSFHKGEDLTVLQKAVEQKQYPLALREIYNFMNRLKEIILSPEKTEAVENIYYKRHIAAGIPSMYGEYREPKFDALGLMYKLERVAAKMMNQILQYFNSEYITAKTFRQIYDILELFKDGLELDGIYNQGFNSHIDMLRFSLASPSFSIDQYVNIFEFMANDIKQIIREYFFDIFESPMKVIIPQLHADNLPESEGELRKLYHIESERFLRDNLSTAFLVQDLDNFITDIIDVLRNLTNAYPKDIIKSMMTYDPDLTFSPLSQHTEDIDNPVFLGAKAYFLKKLKEYQFPVPSGFVITTEVFRHIETINTIPEMMRDFDLLIENHIAKVEDLTGKYFGKADNPLFFSIRSGSSISMPGAMKTFLNVGMNDAIAEAYSKKEGCGWTAWDCYRRFLQSWGMAYGMKRDDFDQIMKEHKEKRGVAFKIQFTDDQMKQLALSYKEALTKRGIHVKDEPFEQLKLAIHSVMDSWFSESAINYRNHSQVAEEWGTAVVVQEMVLGNQSDNSGSGVIFTSSPFNGTTGMNLYGDFALCSQGEDIVSGLVNTLPITEDQRKRHYKDSSMSLESAFPKIYQALMRYAKRLLEEYGFVHQEIEFTFESEQPDDLYILQTRNQNLKKSTSFESFAPPLKQMQRVGYGIGVSSGVLSGILAFDLDDIHTLKEEQPDQKIILVRPDTVPDDIPQIFACDGLITAKGGVTSHAAVTAASIGKVCIVKCRGLVVDDQNKRCTINGHTFVSGDEISIDGSLGNIYKGNYEIITI